MPSAFNPATPPLKVPVSDRDHSIGPADAPLLLVEYGDYQCPHCGRAHPVVKEILGRYGARLRFVFRHFPLVKDAPAGEASRRSRRGRRGAGRRGQVLGDARPAVHPPASS